MILVGCSMHSPQNLSKESVHLAIISSFQYFALLSFRIKKLFIIQTASTQLDK